MDQIRMEPDGGVPVFYPTWEQFRSFKDFIALIEPLGMQTGIVKIVPPPEWLERVPKVDNELIASQVKIKSPIEQEASGVHGVFSFKNILKRRGYTLAKWRKYCEMHSAPRTFKQPGVELWEHDDGEYTPERCKELENIYWRTLGFNSPVYAADVQGTLFQGLEEWNVAELDSLLAQLPVKIPGVNSSYIYCGSWKASFAWHLEDMDLHSINYIHFGAPKQWYSIPQADKDRFYEVMKSYWPRDQRKCHEFLRHKNYMVSPAVLEKNGIQVNRIVHRQHEFMITFPYGYHAGYNLGYNLAESVNFATEAWAPIGRASQPCKCASDNACFDVRMLLGEVPAAPAPYMTPPEDELLDFEPEPAAGAMPVHKRREHRLRRTGECCLCPHQWNSQYLPTATGAKCHAVCAKLVPETWIEGGVVHGVENVPQDRFGLRCVECKVGSGACFQCESASCTRAFHATCAASAGVATVGEQYLCRHHRPAPPSGPQFARALEVGDVVQCQIANRTFAGTVVAQHRDEQAVEVRIFPNFDDTVEVSHYNVVPGAFTYIQRAPIAVKRKRKPAAEKKRAKAAAELEPKATAESGRAAGKLEPEPKLEREDPTPYVPEKTHLYGIDQNGETVSPFMFMGVPLPACLTRTTAL